MVGICNIRHHLNQEFLVHIAGHIGYSIHPEERRKGYATEQLRLALLEAKKLGIAQVLITAADWNIASQKTIHAMVEFMRIPVLTLIVASVCSDIRLKICNY